MLISYLNSSVLDISIGFGIPLIILIFIIIGVIAGAKMIFKSLISTIIASVCAILLCNVLWKALDANTLLDEKLYSVYNKLFTNVLGDEFAVNHTIREIFDSGSAIGTTVYGKTMRKLLALYESNPTYQNIYANSLINNTAVYYSGVTGTLLVLFVAIKIVLFVLMCVFKITKKLFDSKVINITLGALFGLIEGCIICCIALSALNLFAPTLTKTLIQNDSSGIFTTLSQANPLNQIQLKFTDEEYILKKCESQPDSDLTPYGM